MSLDTNFVDSITRIAAATAANALPALRDAVNTALNLGLTKEEINQIITTAREVRDRNNSYTEHLAAQLLREQGKRPAAHIHSHTHGPDCGCHS